LRIGNNSIESIASETSLTIANASQHLQVLRAARLVDAEKQGYYVKYRPADLVVCRFFHSMRFLAEDRLAEIEMIKRRFLQSKGAWNRSIETSCCSG
jgi:DNA-binding transcriptional ArsR family regulator